MPWQKAVGVMEMAGLGADVALNLIGRVNAHGEGIVVQGKEEDMRLMAGMFADIGMETTVQPALPSALQTH